MVMQLPLHVDRRDGYIRIVDTNGVRIAVMTGRHDCIEDMEANAKVIANAANRKSNKRAVAEVVEIVARSAGYSVWVVISNDGCEGVFTNKAAAEILADNAWGVYEYEVCAEAKEIKE